MSFHARPFSRNPAGVRGSVIPGLLPRTPCGVAAKQSKIVNRKSKIT
jgi:hypothetical protein